jgi:DNA-3-methyladenine glycosylase II
MTQHTTMHAVAGPWSLATSRAFWEGFAPATLADQGEAAELRTVFLVDDDWSRAAATVRQEGSAARITVTGDGDLHAAAAQTARYLSLDVDGQGWPAVGDRDRVIGAAQERLPGLRPCGFHSPYEAATWAVLSQRLRITQAARLRSDLIRRHGHDGAVPTPDRLRALELDLPGRKVEYLRAVADAALDGLLNGSRLRHLDPEAAVAQVQQIKGLGPFAAELVVIRGANHPDALPHHEARLDAEIVEQYGPGTTLNEIAPAWRPYRTWAVVHLRALREQRTHEISGPSATNARSPRS